MKKKELNSEIISFEQLGNQVRLRTAEKEILLAESFVHSAFTDSHGHVFALGKQLNEIELSSCRSEEECVEQIKKSGKYRGEWIVGRGWNNELWKNKNFPAKEILDYHFPSNPVFLIRVDGHSAWVNSKAIEESRILESNELPKGAKIELRTENKPTGIVFDNAIQFFKRKIPKYSKNEIKTIILDACFELLRNGITTVHDMDVHPELLKIYNELAENNKLPLNIISFVSGNENQWLEYNIKPYSINNFHVVGVKLFADGSLGSRSAAMLEDYSDSPGNKGLFLESKESLFSKSKAAIESGFEVAVHAIGDAANRLVLENYDRLFSEKIAESNTVLRLEHAQHIHTDDYKYLQNNRIIASIQPIHCISDVATITECRIGVRSGYAYPWKSLNDSGVTILGGSDFPIEPHNPFLGIYAFTNRIPFGEIKSWNAKEKLSYKEAIESYTTNSKELYNKYLHSNKDLVITDKQINNENFSKNTKILASISNNTFFDFQNS